MALGRWEYFCVGFYTNFHPVSFFKLSAKLNQYVSILQTTFIHNYSFLHSLCRETGSRIRGYFGHSNIGEHVTNSVPVSGAYTSLGKYPVRPAFPDC